MPHDATQRNANQKELSLEERQTVSAQPLHPRAAACIGG
jgi:hypothetical protein